MGIMRWAFYNRLKEIYPDVGFTFFTIRLDFFLAGQTLYLVGEAVAISMSVPC